MENKKQCDGWYALAKLSEFLNASGNFWWVDHGTLLGIVRSNTFIPWDTDIDIGMFDMKYNAKINLARRLKKIFPSSNFSHSENSIRIPRKKGLYNIDISFYSLQNGYVEKYWLSWTEMSDKERKKYRISRILDGDRSVFQWNLFIRPVTLMRAVATVIIPRFICSHLSRRIGKEFSYITSRVDAKYFKTLSSISLRGLNIPLPSLTDEYLVLRYGKNFMKPKKNWHYAKDDGTIINN